jgi:pimeloyl-ACP methyl ester carboxylesterase
MKEWLIRVVVGIAVLVVVVIGVTWVAAGELPDPAKRDFDSSRAPLPDTSTVTFASGSGSLVQGWISVGDPGHGVVMLLHSLRGDRRDMLSRAQFLRARGHSVLLFDFHAHGQTQGSQITFGDLESRDVTAAIHYLQHKLPNERIGVLGVSMGAAAFMLADDRPPVTAVVLEQMYLTIEQAVEIRARQYVGPLAPLFGPLLMTQMQSRLQIPDSRLQITPRMARIGASLLLIDGTRDHATPLEDARALLAAAAAPKDLWAVEGAGHVNLYTFNKTDYERRVGDFFSSLVQ